MNTLFSILVSLIGTFLLFFGWYNYGVRAKNNPPGMFPDMMGVFLQYLGYAGAFVGSCIIWIVMLS